MPTVKRRSGTPPQGRPGGRSPIQANDFVSTQGFCHAAALAAVLTIGSAGLAFLAASGGAVIAGVFLRARISGQMSPAAAGTAGHEALMAMYVC